MEAHARVALKPSGFPVYGTLRVHDRMCWAKTRNSKEAVS